MRYELYKIVAKKHAGDFVAGRLYMNSLSYFRGVEDNPAQGDPLEGVCGTIRKDQLRQFGLYFDDGIVDAMRGGVSLISDYYGLNNLLCLYRLGIDDERRLFEQPSEQLRSFNDPGSPGKMAVRIRDTEEFLRRVSSALEAAVREHRLEYAILGPVSYSSAWSSVDGPGTRSAFHKGPEFTYQREWRLCILRPALLDEAFTLEVGDLSDITETLTLEELITHPAPGSLGYTAVERLDEPDDGYRMFGSRNAVSQLMYSYIAPQKAATALSDKAEAARHYAEFLRLSGRKDEIDAYLEERMHAERDLDHLKLLSDHRLAAGQWVRATDAFAYYLKSAPEAIAAEPARFFFELHTILMQHREPADAGKFLMIAEAQYSLPDDLRQTMWSDVLFALGFYDRAAELYEQMQTQSDDPIIDYYLAVSYLHLLKFDRAREHAERYARFFAHDPKYARKAAKLFELLDIFSTAPPEPPPAESAPEELLRQLENAKGRTVYLGFEALCTLEKSQSWAALEPVTAAEVCPMLICELMQLYLETRDDALLRIVSRLAAMPQLRLVSPRPEIYLDIDTQSRDIAPLAKMHRAAIAQSILKQKQRYPNRF